ncbi:hypothetical protein TNIN_66101 [Trichonephila inaurata madagascariensis]|uniref:EF-hand domain-containing protein n=1 Tax=Trichonephila inaurata madagascariensis TaxID=2747483 RepID=A0A8X6YRN3_9ARAC|nr:hypothetical protein TNIN_66101 [Trichonephila inaurata madagascariensis]
MTMIITLTAVIAASSFMYVSCTELHHHNHPSPEVMMSLSADDERHHIGQHMSGVVDLDQMTEHDMKFLYFKIHDSDNNNKLDGCELVKSLLHWHVEECKAMGEDHAHHGTTKIFKHEELAFMIDPILSTDDSNLDGFIDYPEFISAQKSRGF